MAVQILAIETIYEKKSSYIIDHILKASQQSAEIFMVSLHLTLSNINTKFRQILKRPLSRSG